MGWGRFLLLGDLGQQLDVMDNRRSLEDVRDSLDQKYRRDQRQDEQIRGLQKENVELKLTLNRLAGLLVQRGTITMEDLKKIAGDLEEAELPGKDDDYS